MASGKVSKNVRTSKPVQFIKPVKEKKRKETIMVELTDQIKQEIKEDLSVYQGRQILNIKRKYGKDYLVLANN